MSARKKINVAHINGSLILGAIIGVVTESTTVFAIMTIIFVGSAIYSKDIRF